MRLLFVLCAFGLLVAGCTSGVVTAPSSEGATTSPAQSAVTSLGADPPPNNSSLDRTDKAGHSPDESVLALIAAMNLSDWRTAYSGYASPTVDFTGASREWAAAHETYLEFRVLEVRVTASDAAWVRVVYGVSANPMSSAIQPVIVTEPGEWWPVQKVGGLWKTRWMPRQ